MSDTPTGPITGGEEAITEIGKVIEKAIPPDEIRIASYKENHPFRYAAKKSWQLVKARIHLRLNKREDIDTYVDFIESELLVSDREEMKKLLHEDLGR